MAALPASDELDAALKSLAAAEQALASGSPANNPRIPDADAIVNPNVPGDAFPSKALAGVGVMFYVLAALRSHLREAGWFAAQRLAEPNLAAWLDLVALGTVADVAVQFPRSRRARRTPDARAAAPKAAPHWCAWESPARTTVRSALGSPPSQ